MTEARTLPILPLRDIVVFPHQPVPLFVGRDKSVRALEEAMKSEAREILLATQKNKDDDDPGAEGIYDVGVIAAILQLLRLRQIGNAVPPRLAEVVGRALLEAAR